MKKMKLEEKYKGTYLYELIELYNNFLDNPKFYDKKAYEYLKGLRKEIAELRKSECKSNY